MFVPKPPCAPPEAVAFGTLQLPKSGLRDRPLSVVMHTSRATTLEMQPHDMTQADHAILFLHPNSLHQTRTHAVAAVRMRHPVHGMQWYLLDSVHPTTLFDLQNGALVDSFDADVCYLVLADSTPGVALPRMQARAALLPRLPAARARAAADEASVGRGPAPQEEPWGVRNTSQTASAPPRSANGWQRRSPYCRSGSLCGTLRNVIRC